jgi:hypothetical protein
MAQLSHEALLTWRCWGGAEAWQLILFVRQTMIDERHVIGEYTTKSLKTYTFEGHYRLLSNGDVDWNARVLKYDKLKGTPAGVILAPHLQHAEIRIVVRKAIEASIEDLAGSVDP